jgi:hypothetical protein
MRAKNGSLEFVIETGPEFFPPDSAPLQIAVANVEGGLYLLDRVFGPGITGHVFDANTYQPILAEIRVVEVDSTQLYVEPRKNDSIFGRFFRLLNNGVYTVEVIAEGYDTIRLENVVVDDTLKYLTFNLVSLDEYVNNYIVPIKIYPNPFTNSTTLKYELQQPELVTLSIYNHLGQLVYQTQVNQPQGKQQLIWNAEGYADGVYYYRLQVGDAVANGKMVKVR